MSVPRIDTQLNKALAQKLKDLRIARGLSQMRVTMDTGVNVSRAESGKRSLSVHSVAILADIMNSLWRNFSIISNSPLFLGSKANHYFAKKG